MARVTEDTVDHVARLANLSLTAAERATFAAQLDEILTYAEGLAALDISDVVPMSHAGGEAVLREDEPQPGLSHPGFFKVPRVIGG